MPAEHGYAIWGTSQQPPRTAAVTGGSGGLGRAVAIALGELGWTVAIGARRLDRLEETAAAVNDAGGRAVTCRLDVADPGSVGAFFERVEAQAGPVDVLVNNAGITHLGSVADTEPAAIVEVVGTNLIGPYLMSQQFLHRLRARNAPSGHLIFISSKAVETPWPHQVLYGTTKTGLDALARGIGGELEGTGIRSTIVRIGPVVSEIGANLDPTLALAVTEEWSKRGILRNFSYLPTEQAARAVAIVASSPPEMLVREIYVDSIGLSEPLSADEINAQTGRPPAQV